jgi:hypothetical protein
MVIVSIAVPAAITQVDARIGCKFTALSAILNHFGAERLRARQIPPQGLKPIIFCYVCGTTEVVP